MKTYYTYLLQRKVLTQACGILSKQLSASQHVLTYAGNLEPYFTSVRGDLIGISLPNFIPLLVDLSDLVSETKPKLKSKWIKKSPTIAVPKTMLIVKRTSLSYIAEDISNGSA